MGRVDENQMPEDREPRGYILGPSQSARDILAVTDNLLKDEGLEVSWPTRREAVVNPKARRSVEE